MSHRIAAQVEVDLDEIWIYIALESGSMDSATRVVDSIADRFHLLSGFPYAGRARGEDLGPGMRTFPAGEYIIAYCI